MKSTSDTEVKFGASVAHSLYQAEGTPVVGAQRFDAALMQVPGQLKSHDEHRADMRSAEVHQPYVPENIDRRPYNTYGDVILRYTCRSREFRTLLLASFSERCAASDLISDPPVEEMPEEDSVDVAIEAGLEAVVDSLEQLNKMEAARQPLDEGMTHLEIVAEDRARMREYASILLDELREGDDLAYKIAAGLNAFIEWLGVNHENYAFLGFHKVRDVYASTDDIKPVRLRFGIPDLILFEIQDNDLSPLEVEQTILHHDVTGASKRRKSGSYLQDVVAILAPYMEDGSGRLSIVDFKQRDATSASEKGRVLDNSEDERVQLLKYLVGCFPSYFCADEIRVHAGSEEIPDMSYLLGFIDLHILELSPEGWEMWQTPLPDEVILTTEILRWLRWDSEIAETLRRLRRPMDIPDELSADERAYIQATLPEFMTPEDDIANSRYMGPGADIAEPLDIRARDSLGARLQAIRLFNEQLRPAAQKRLLEFCDEVSVLFSRFGHAVRCAAAVEFPQLEDIQTWLDVTTMYARAQGHEEAFFHRIANENRTERLYKQVMSTQTGWFFLEANDILRENFYNNTYAFPSVISAVERFCKLKASSGLPAAYVRTLRQEQVYLQGLADDFVASMDKDFPVLRFVKERLEDAVLTGQMSLIDFAVVFLFNLDGNSEEFPIIERYRDGTLVTRFVPLNLTDPLVLVLPPDADSFYLYRDGESLIPVEGLEHRDGRIRIYNADGDSVDPYIIKWLFNSFYGYTSDRKRHLPFILGEQLDGEEIEILLEEIHENLLAYGDGNTQRWACRVAGIPPGWLGSDLDVAHVQNAVSYMSILAGAGVDTRMGKDSNLAFQLGFTTHGSSIWNDAGIYFPKGDAVEHNGSLVIPLRDFRSGAMTGLGLQTLYTISDSDEDGKIRRRVFSTRMRKVMPPIFNQEQIHSVFYSGERALACNVYIVEGILNAMSLRALLGEFIENAEDICVVGVPNIYDRNDSEAILDDLVDMATLGTAQFPSSHYHIIPRRNWAHRRFIDEEITRSLGEDFSVRRNLYTDFWSRVRQTFSNYDLEMPEWSECHDVNELWLKILDICDGSVINHNIVWRNEEGRRLAEQLIRDIFDIHQGDLQDRKPLSLKNLATF